MSQRRRSPLKPELTETSAAAVVSVPAAKAEDAAKAAIETALEIAGQTEGAALLVYAQPNGTEPATTLTIET